MAGGRGLAGEPGRARAVERQMQNWELARAQRLSLPVESRPEIEDFVCISRQAGIDGREIAEGVAARLGWPLFDREVLDLMAGDDEVRRRLYEAVDERDFKWWEAAMSPWVVGRFVQDDYFHRLCEAVLMLARQGRCVFLGRGAHRILPAGQGLRVRLRAGLAGRARALAAARQLTLAEARETLESEERGRAEFFRRRFRTDLDDPAGYDLVLDLDRWAESEVVELILGAHALRGRRTNSPG
ncbi:MAG: cytidylate kinase family protein [Thermoanaerobaculia bacterium]|nr:cytidylate kinase family protein [Thermoanaerobaculia bacterium]